MKRLFMFCFLGLLPFAANANAPDAVAKYTVKVSVDGINSDKGTIVIGLYDKQDNFKKREGAFKGAHIESKNGKIEYTFTDIPSGTYAIALFHDANGNGKLDKNRFGAPIEGFGFSNNARKRFGPPSFDDAKFEVNEDVALEIKMIY